MKLDCARPMNSNDLAFNFLTKALGIPENEADEFSQHIMKAERLLETMELQSTLVSPENRRPLYKKEERRILLRRQIFDELKDLPREDDDNAICLGRGGAKPKSDPVAGKEAIILIGPPASGKSSVANLVAEMYGAYIIDSDYAKRKIPEFDHEFGASIVHEESSLVTMGLDDEKYSEEMNLYEFCIAKELNFVMPKIGHNFDSVRKIRESLIEKGYLVHLVLISLDRHEACKRAVYRYINDRRYVPLSLVFDVYGNEPILTYYRVRDDSEWASVGKLSTLNLKDRGPEAIFSRGDGPVEKLKEQGVAA